MGLATQRHEPHFFRPESDRDQPRMVAGVLVEISLRGHHRFAGVIGSVPNRPAGSSPKARWFQWAHDSILSAMRVRDVRGAKVSRTNQGVFVEPLGGGEGSGGSAARQYVLISASNPDYFVCRTWDDSGETPRSGGTDIFIAKPFHLRQSPFDGVTYDIEVETWDGAALNTETHSLTYDYKSATFRIANDTTEDTTEFQTVIPRFVKAVLAEPEGGPVTTAT